MCSEVALRSIAFNDAEKGWERRAFSSYCSPYVRTVQWMELQWKEGRGEGGQYAILAGAGSTVHSRSRAETEDARSREEAVAAKTKEPDRRCRVC